MLGNSQSFQTISHAISAYNFSFISPEPSAIINWCAVSRYFSLFSSRVGSTVRPDVQRWRETCLGTFPWATDMWVASHCFSQVWLACRGLFRVHGRMLGKLQVCLQGRRAAKQMLGGELPEQVSDVAARPGKAASLSRFSHRCSGL